MAGVGREGTRREEEASVPNRGALQVKRALAALSLQAPDSGPALRGRKGGREGGPGLPQGWAWASGIQRDPLKTTGKA